MWVADHTVLINSTAEMEVQVLMNFRNLTGSIFLMINPLKVSNLKNDKEHK